MLASTVEVSCGYAAQIDKLSGLYMNGRDVLLVIVAFRVMGVRHIWL